MHRVIVEAGERAIRTQQPARRGDPGANLMAVALPVFQGTRVVGALCVAGPGTALDETSMAVYADCASLALSRHPRTTATPSLVEHLDALLHVGNDLDVGGLLNRALEAADDLFAARAGFVCLLEGGIAEVTRYRGISREHLREAVSHPEFKALVSSPSATVETSAHPVVARLTDGAEVAACLPLWAGRRRLGALVLLLPEEPRADMVRLLEAFGRHVALALRSATVWQQLQDHEERLASIVHSMPNPVVVVDEAGSFVVVNGAAAEVFGLTGAFEVGQPARGRLGHGVVESLLLGDTPDSATEVLLGVSNPRTYRASVRRVMSASGRMLGRVLVLDDITEARESEQVKSDFVAVIGHELRTPLTVVKGYVHALAARSDQMSPERRAEAVHAIKEQAGRLERLVDDLLFVSTEHQREPRLKLETLDVRRLVEELVATIAEEYVDRVVTVASSVPTLEAAVDGAKVEQILRHLLDNAMKYSEGPVSVEVADRGNAFEIGVVDAGPGIFSGDLPHLFERFRQLDGSNTREHGGTGLGLYVCRRLVEAMGGRIWCDSRISVGSRFAIRVPRMPSNSAGDGLPLASLGRTS
jgi:signal transduction histidine kinase